MKTTRDLRAKVQLLQREHHYKVIEDGLKKEGEMIKLKGTHLDSMDNITKEITRVTEAAHQGVQRNITSSGIASVAVAQLTQAEQILIQAHQAFYKALDESQQVTNKYQLQATQQLNIINQTTEQGRADIGKENTLAEKQFKTIATKAEIDTKNGTQIIQAYLNVYKAEHQAKTKLDIKQIEETSKTTLAKQEKEAITPILEQQLEARRINLSVQLEQKLAKCDHTELKAFSKIIEDKIEEQTQLIAANPQSPEEYKKTRSGLEELAGKIDAIAKKPQEPSLESTAGI